MTDRTSPETEQVPPKPQYVVEGIILRRLFEKRIEGYTIETAKEIVEALSRPEYAPCPGLPEPIAMINRRLEDLAEANAIYGNDQRLSAPDKIARNDREISWLKDLRSTIASPDTSTDRCAKCNYPRAEHSYNGACYGLCGEFVPPVSSPEGNTK
jgi:hypothetical protein